MSIRRNASLNPTLTNFAVGLAQDMARKLAEFISPTVLVGSSVGQYKEFSDKNAFQVYNTARALGGGATRIHFDAADPSYNCQPQALEITVDDAERDAAGDDEENPLRLDEAKITTLLSSTSLSHESQVLAVAKTLTAVADVGEWSNPANDPILEIDAQIEALATDTGLMPNRLAIGLPAWKIIRHHPKVLARMPGAAVQGTTLAQFAGMLLNPGIEIEIGVLSQDRAKFGKAKDAVNLYGAELLLFLASQNPTQYDPSFMKTFTIRRGGVSAVRTYRDESARSDVHAVDWSRDIKKTSAACGRRIVLS